MDIQTNPIENSAILKNKAVLNFGYVTFFLILFYHQTSNFLAPRFSHWPLNFLKKALTSQQQTLFQWPQAKSRASLLCNWRLWNPNSAMNMKNSKSFAEKVLQKVIESQCTGVNSQECNSFKKILRRFFNVWHKPDA